MLKLSLLSILLFFNCNLLNAQDLFSTYLDIGGASPVLSINVDKRFNKSSSVGFGFKLGIGLVGLDVVDPPRTYLKYKPSFPFGVNYVFGRENKVSNIEAAVQGTYIPVMSVFDAWDPDYQYVDPIHKQIIPSLFLGYRIRPFRKKGLIRLGYSPIYFNNKWQNWLNLSLGGTLKKKK